jgi:hypothetical protein
VACHGLIDIARLELVNYFMLTHNFSSVGRHGCSLSSLFLQCIVFVPHKFNFVRLCCAKQEKSYAGNLKTDVVITHSR